MQGRHPEGLLACRWVGPTPGASEALVGLGEAWESAFLISSQAMLMVLFGDQAWRTMHSLSQHGAYTWIERWK